MIALVPAALGVAVAPAWAARDMPVAPATPGGDPYAPAVARTVGAMIDYTRWPAPADPLTLCVAGPAAHAGWLDRVRLAGGRGVQRRPVAPAPAALAGCEVLYLGALPLPAQRGLTGAVQGKGVLTIAEADPDCRSEAMFCLVFEPRALTFRLNVDAISRSGLKVDPRVLRLAERL